MGNLGFDRGRGKALPLPVTVLHAISLDTVGGVECLFADYLPAASGQLKHHVLVGRGRVHPNFRNVVRRHAASVHQAKYVGPVKLPRFPAALRAARKAAIVRKVSPDVVVLWNCLGEASQAELSRLGRRAAASIYYEHGAAWRAHAEAGAAKVLSNARGVICNSRASRRMLELQWACPSGRAQVLYNGLRLAPPAPGTVAKALPGERPVRLGFAGRLVGLKGAALALHALRTLNDAGGHFTLAVAGTGPEEEGLRGLAERLGQADRVTFRGMVKDMAAFYSWIDVLLCPSVREPLGNVCMEAEYYGCPVCGTAVDGIPEIVSDGETGYCIRPSLPVEAYAELGGVPGKMPQSVYDPSGDCLREPRLVDPEDLARAVAATCADGDRFARMSARAHCLAAERFDFGDYCRALDDYLLRMGNT